MEVPNDAIHAIINRASRGSLSRSASHPIFNHPPCEVRLQTSRAAVENRHLIGIVAPNSVEDREDLVLRRAITAYHNPISASQALCHDHLSIISEQL